MIDVGQLSKNLVLGGLLEALGDYDLVAHWTQGEFHHDLVVRTHDEVLVIATNCNGGVKEVLARSELRPEHRRRQEGGGWERR